jgi:hypothetical protein
MTKVNWLKKANNLAGELENKGTGRATTPVANNYRDLRKIIFNDHHHAPVNERCDKLCEQVRGWIERVNNNQIKESCFTRQ